MKTILRGHALAALALIAALTGCAGSPTRYYSLAEAAAAASSATAAASAASAASAAPTASTAAGFVEFAPVAMPERFARPQMVVRAAAPDDGAGVDVLEDHRWAASFEDELRDALASGVAARLGTVDATKSGRPAGQAGTRVAVQLRRFDAAAGRGVEAAFSWTLRRSDAPSGVACQLALSESAGPGIDGVALAARRVAARLADGIAGSVKALQQGAGAGAGCVG